MSSNTLRLIVNFATTDRLSGPLKQIVGLGQSGTEKLSALKKTARDLGKEMANVQADLSRASGNVSGLVNRERELADAIARTNKQRERQERLNAINAQTDALKQRGDGLRASGTGNIVAGVAMAAPGVLAVKQAMTFESAMADVKKVVTFKKPEQFRQMSDDILDLSTKIPIAAEGLAQIVAAAGRAGIAREELLTFAQDAAQMGVAFDTTAEEAGNMMAKWRTAFGLGQKDVRTLADQINALTNSYGGNVAAVSGIVTRIGSLGKVTGVLAPQIAAMGQLMNSVGVEEEVAATGLKNFMLAMTKGPSATKSQQQAFAALGLDAVKVSEAMQKNAAGAIEDILKRIAKLPKAQQTAALTNLFGSESVGAIAPMLTNLGKLQRNFQMVGDKSKYAESMTKEYLSAIATTEGATGLAKNALSAINIKLGQELLPTIVTASHEVIAIAGSVRSWTKEHPALTHAMVAGYASLVGFNIGLGLLKFALGAALGPFAQFYRAWKLLKLAKDAGKFASLASGIGKVGGALGGAGRWALVAGKNFVVAGFNFTLMAAKFVVGQIAGAASVLFSVGRAALTMGWGFMRAGIMMMANPIVLTIMAIVAVLGIAGFLIYKHWDTIKGAFVRGWTATKTWLSGIPSWLGNLGRMMMDGLLRALNPSTLKDRLIGIARSGITAFKNFFGIKSPSRLMMAMGGYITEGLSGGIDRGTGGAVRAARGMAAAVAGASLATAAPAIASPGPGLAQAAAASARGAAASAPGSVGAGGISIANMTVTVTAAPGQSPESIAQAVAEEFRKHTDKAAAAKRSSYRDDD